MVSVIFSGDLNLYEEKIAISELRVSWILVSEMRAATERKRNDNDIAPYKLAHASSSSGVSQSFDKTASLSSTVSHYGSPVPLTIWFFKRKNNMQHERQRNCQQPPPSPMACYLAALQKLRGTQHPRHG